MHEATHYWHWLLVMEMFLGGMAGACFYTGALADFFSKGKYRRLAKIGSYCVLPLVVLTLIFLLLDLPPARVFYFWHFLIIRPGSVMNQGVWILTLFTIIGGIIVPAFYLAEDKGMFAFLKGKEGARKFFSVIGVILGFLTAGYSGVILAEKAVPLWSSTVFLPALWIVTAAATGIALLRLILALSAKKDPEAMNLLGKALSTVLIIDLIVLAILLLALRGAAPEAAAVLISGSYAFLFWVGIVIVGLVAPLVMELMGTTTVKAPEAGTGMATLASVLVLLLGFLVRWVFLYGGQV